MWISGPCESLNDVWSEPQKKRRKTGRKQDRQESLNCVSSISWEDQTRSFQSIRRSSLNSSRICLQTPVFRATLARKSRLNSVHNHLNRYYYQIEVLVPGWTRLGRDITPGRVICGRGSRRGTFQVEYWSLRHNETNVLYKTTKQWNSRREDYQYKPARKVDTITSEIQITMTNVVIWRLLLNTSRSKYKT